MHNIHAVLNRMPTLMRLSLYQLVLIACGTGLALAGPGKAQELMNRKITLQAVNTPVRTILANLEKSASVQFMYTSAVINHNQRATLTARDQRLGDVLASLLNPIKVNYRLVNNDVIMLNREQVLLNGLATPTVANEDRLADREVSGIITGSDDGKPLPGVSVLLKGTSRGVTANAQGRFQINVPDNNATLVFSFVGYLPKEVVVGTASQFTITLLIDNKTLSEVVVVGYGTQRKGDVTGALSSISASDFQQQPVTRLDQALQGRATGVQVTNATGAPGGDVRIRIRGANSINGDNNPLYVVDGFVGADFNTINPDDIASIQVLKDASSTAVYGSRGANGVVIITTRTGGKGGTQVSFGTRFSSSEVINRFNTLSASDFAGVVNERAAATNTNPVFTQAQIAGFRQDGGTDWQNEIFRKAGGQEYQLGISGGGDKTTYLISANYLTQNGVINNSDYKRYSLRSNINTQVSDRFSVRLNLTGSRRENHNTDGYQAKTSPLTQALAWAPTTPARDATGNYTFRDPVGSLFDNPIALTTDADNRTERTNLNLVGGLRYDILDGLSLDVQYGINYLNQQNKQFAGPVISNNLPNASRVSVEQIMLQNINTLNYRRVFNTVHRLDITGVFETQEFTQNAFSATANNLTYPAQSYNNLALAATGSINSGFAKWTLMSVLGRVNYAFSNRYLLSATIRRDGSSKFQGNNKYSVFPSVGAGWVVSEEAFMRNQKLFTNLKLRASWGLTGSQAINPYGTLSSYLTDAYSAGTAFGPGGLTSGIVLGSPGNPNLKWETTEQTNIGADMELLRGRVTLNADYFVKNTRDLLLYQPLPGYVGGNGIYRNVGQVQNKGWEIGLSVTPISKPAFGWTSTLNFSTVDNRVVSLGDNTDLLFTGSNVGSGTSTQSEFVLIPGQSMGAYWGLRYLGTWKPSEADLATKFGEKPGDSRYQDIDGDGAITPKDFQVIGTGIPRTSVGWNNTFTHRRLSLNVFWQGILGFDKLNYTYAAAIAGSADARQPVLQDILDRYVPGRNETSDIPAFSTTNKTYLQSSRFLEKGDFVRLKNISLTYDVPKTVLKGIASARVFVSATNLLTFTKYKGLDPESSSVGSGTDTNQSIDYGSFPNSKTYTLGLNFTF